MEIKIEKKLTDLNIDEFINSVYLNHKTFPEDNYVFDLTEVEFISNQELLLFTGLLKTFIDSNISFFVRFLKLGISTDFVNDRIKKQIIQFWDVWKIWKIVPGLNYNDYFDIDGNTVEGFQKELEYYPKLSEIYDRHGVTPFVSLGYIKNYKSVEIEKQINNVYKINETVEEILSVNRCYHPFTSESLSTIITEELYLNFLDHSLNSSFQKLKN